MNRDRLLYLIDVCKSQRATSEERNELENWYASFDLTTDVPDLFGNDENRIRRQIWGSLEARPELSPILDKKGKQINIFQSFLLRAALVALVMGLSVYLFTQNSPDLASPDDKQVQIIEDIQPGGNNATLILADGSVVDLQSIEAGKVIQQNGLSVIKTQDGQIAYKTEANNSSINELELTYNTIKTPRGGQYQVVLPDGTYVWLNAASSLTYPTRFESAERVITLSGEAYIEVSPKYAKDGKRVPFKVRTKNQEIQVIGTHFNVKAYEEEKETFTTLLEGKVKLIGFENGNRTAKERVLRVGETVSWSDNSFEISHVALEKVIAWKNGKFIFTGDNVKNIMKDVSRWYDVDVSYQGDLSNVNFEGSLSRYENISEILRKLELTGTVRFKIISENADQRKGRRIEVMQ